jgi:catechol 2,3-dioxygenase-like lactoylglutathione lyase family enzyme
MRRIVTTAILCLAGSASLCAQAPVVGVGTFIHVVADLDKTIRFYGDRLGLEMNGAPGPRTFAPNAVVESLYDAKGSQSRVAVFKIPGSPLGLEFVEFKGIAQKPYRPRIKDPGASLLLLPVHDVPSVIARLKEDRTRLIGDNAVTDPDGFYIGLVESGQSAGLSLTVENLDRTLYLFRDVLGFQARGNTAKIPGTDFEVEFVESKGAGKQTIPAIHDPGAGVLRLFVRSVDSMLPALKNAGFLVVSAEGETVSIGARHVTILRDPDNFFVQIFDQPAGR